MTESSEIGPIPELGRISTVRLDVVDVQGQLNVCTSRFCAGVVLLEQNLTSEGFPPFGVVPLPDISVVAAAFLLTCVVRTHP